MYLLISTRDFSAKNAATNAARCKWDSPLPTRVFPSFHTGRRISLHKIHPSSRFWNDLHMDQSGVVETLFVCRYVGPSWTSDQSIFTNPWLYIILPWTTAIGHCSMSHEGQRLPKICIASRYSHGLRVYVWQWCSILGEILLQNPLHSQSTNADFNCEESQDYPSRLSPTKLQTQARLAVYTNQVSCERSAKPHSQYFWFHGSERPHCNTWILLVVGKSMHSKYPQGQVAGTNRGLGLWRTKYLQADYESRPKAQPALYSLRMKSEALLYFSYANLKPAHIIFLKLTDMIMLRSCQKSQTGKHLLLRSSLCSGREFAQCPIPRGEKDQAVEPVTDSSRYFVIRLMTPGDARQKAFVGLGFDDRSDAFDFQVALVCGNSSPSSKLLCHACLSNDDRTWCTIRSPSVMPIKSTRFLSKNNENSKAWFQSTAYSSHQIDSNLAPPSKTSYLEMPCSLGVKLLSSQTSVIEDFVHTSLCLPVKTEPQICMQTDHEKHLRRAQDTALAAQSSSTPSIQNSSRSEFSSDAANLYQSRDLSLKEGETMKINFKRPGDSQAGSGLKLGQNSGQQLPKTILTIPPPTQQRAPTTSTQSQQPTQAAEQQQVISEFYVCNPCVEGVWKIVRNLSILVAAIKI